VENGSLADIIKKFGPLSEKVTANYMRQVLLGLDYLHNQGVIHRDIKGANILAAKEAHVKLADFGVATRLSENEKMNSQVGTPNWSIFYDIIFKKWLQRLLLVHATLRLHAIFGL